MREGPLFHQSLSCLLFKPFSFLIKEVLALYLNWKFRALKDKKDFSRLCLIVEVEGVCALNLSILLVERKLLGKLEWGKARCL